MTTHLIVVAGVVSAAVRATVVVAAAVRIRIAAAIRTRVVVEAGLLALLVALVGDFLVVEEAAGFLHELADGRVILAVVAVVSAAIAIAASGVSVSGCGVCVVETASGVRAAIGITAVKARGAGFAVAASGGRIAIATRSG